MVETSKKLPIATLIIVIINISIFSLAFVVPRLSFWFAISVFVIFTVLMLISKVFQVGLVAYLEKLQRATENIEDDSEREAQHVKNAVNIIIVVFFALLLFPVYRTWVNRLFGLLFSSLISIAIIAYSEFWEIGQNLTTFLYIVSIYLFLRLLVRFTLNPLKENNAFSKIPHILKIILELIRIVFIVVALMGQDGIFMLDEPLPILESVVATIAIDSILATLEKFSAKKEVSPNET